MVFVVYGTNGVDDMLARQRTVGRAYLRVASPTSSKLLALVVKFSACGTVNGTVNAPSAKEGAVSSVDNGVELVEFGDVVPDETDFVIDSC